MRTVDWNYKKLPLFSLEVWKQKWRAHLVNHKYYRPEQANLLFSFCWIITKWELHISLPRSVIRTNSIFNPFQYFSFLISRHKQTIVHETKWVLVFTDYWQVVSKMCVLSVSLCRVTCFASHNFQIFLKKRQKIWTEPNRERVWKRDIHQNSILHLMVYRRWWCQPWNFKLWDPSKCRPFLFLFQNIIRLLLITSIIHQSINHFKSQINVWFISTIAFRDRLHKSWLPYRTRVEFFLKLSFRNVRLCTFAYFPWQPNTYGVKYSRFKLAFFTHWFQNEVRNLHMEMAALMLSHWVEK